MNQPADDCRPGLPPPRFGLGGLMLGIAILGLVFASIHYLGMSWALLVIFFLICILAHVAGNAMGTRLREIGSQSRAEEEWDSSSGRVTRASPKDFAPATRLQERRPLGKPIVIITVFGAAVSGILGGLGLSWLTENKAPWSVTALGTGACVILGAIWTFAAGSFVQVTLGEWLYAARDSRRR